MNKTIYLVKMIDYNKLLERLEFNLEDTAVLIINSVEFIEDSVFRIDNYELAIDVEGILYFDGDYDNYYIKVLTTNAFTYFAIEGEYE